MQVMQQIQRALEEIDRQRIAAGEIKQKHPVLKDDDTEHPIRKCKYVACRRFFFADDPGRLYCSNFCGSHQERAKIFEETVAKVCNLVHYEILDETDYIQNVSRKRRRKIVRTRAKKILRRVLYNMIVGTEERPHDIAREIVMSFPK